MLQFAVATFPGPINKLVALLDNTASGPAVAGSATADIAAEALAAELGLVDAKHRRDVADALSSLQKTYASLPATVQSHVLHHAVEHAITMLPKLAHLTTPGTPTPLQLYERAVDRDLLGRSKSP